MIKKIYLHWTAGRYDQLFGDYHICIDGDGGVHRMADFETKLAHTWRRNSNAVGIALCCCYQARITYLAPPMGGLRKHVMLSSRSTPWNKESAKDGEYRISESRRLTEGVHIHWGLYPPTDMQIVSMAQCVAEICKEYGLPINKDTVMTHAEVAELDGYSIYDADPDLRWDLLRLFTTGNVPGGDVIRNMAKVLIRKEVKEYGAE